MNEPLTYKLSAYEGPLDLLYSLIQTHKIDIFDIPIAELADQYIGFLQKADKRDMDSMSEFTLLAATLLEIKSKMLLPKTDAGEDEEDPRKELVDSLLEYRKAKLAAELFVTLGEENDGFFVKPPEKALLAELKPVETVDDALEGITLWTLFSVFREVMEKKEHKIDKIRSSFNAVRKDKFTVEKKALYILRILNTQKKVAFRVLLESCEGKMEMVVTFLAMLELIKAKEIRVRQRTVFGDIEIRKCV